MQGVEYYNDSVVASSVQHGIYVSKDFPTIQYKGYSFIFHITLLYIFIFFAENLIYFSHRQYIPIQLFFQENKLVLSRKKKLAKFQASTKILEHFVKEIVFKLSQIF